mgnify:CR=1 FL=1
MKDLGELRQDMDRIDRGIMALFEERMAVSEEIAAFKAGKGLPVYDPGREKEKLLRISKEAPEELRDYSIALFTMLFEFSKSRQTAVLGSQGETAVSAMEALEKTPRMFPESAAVACQGVAGANSQLAAERLFRLPEIFYFSSFESVFSAIEKGLCRYGVIPVENSTAGSVNAVYDLMMKHNFRIVRSVRLKIDHNLLARPGVKTEDIKEIFSHEQAIAQCSEFLQKHPGIKVTACENTAAAAKLVSESERRDIAALSSRSCADLYGLEALEESVQDTGNNFTRFICISKEEEIYPGADHTSLMLTLPHRPGSLCSILTRFFALGININKLESRPIPSRNFEFMFYFDLETSVYSPAFGKMLSEIPSLCESFMYLGSYSEVV